jgi:hypothetical protein
MLSQIVKVPTTALLKEEHCIPEYIKIINLHHYLLDKLSEEELQENTSRKSFFLFSSTKKNPLPTINGKHIKINRLLCYLYKFKKYRNLLMDSL